MNATHPPVATGSPAQPARHVCPWWIGYLLVSPLRAVFDPPARTLGPYIRPGMQVLDFGAGMGFYTIPAARLVGENGRVTAADVQPRMLAALARRAARAGLASRIETVAVPPDGLGDLEAARRFDLILAIHAIHETPDPAATFRRLASRLEPGGTLLLLEPRGHVTPADFEREVAAAVAAGLEPTASFNGRRGLGAALRAGAPEPAQLPPTGRASRGNGSVSRRPGAPPGRSSAAPRADA